MNWANHEPFQFRLEDDDEVERDTVHETIPNPDPDIRMNRFDWPKKSTKKCAVTRGDNEARNLLTPILPPLKAVIGQNPF